MSAINPISGAGAIPITTVTKSTTANNDGNFADAIGNAIQNVNTLQNNADQLAQQAATGDLTDIHEYTIAATEASLATELTVAVRNKALEAFNDIMRMPI